MRNIASGLFACILAVNIIFVENSIAKYLIYIIVIVYFGVELVQWIQKTRNK